MQPDALEDSVAASPPTLADRASEHGQIYWRAYQGVLYLYLPTSRTAEIEWSQIWEQLQHRLEASKRLWPPNTPVQLIASDRLIDQRQLQQLADALTAAQLTLTRVRTSRRQTAVAAVSAGYSVDQHSPTLPLAPVPFLQRAAAGPVLAEPLYLQTTLRSGMEVRHPGPVVIVGDLNPGGAVIADGDILVWGRLKGLAHAGANGDTKARIMALQMEPTQLRIADQVARAPTQKPIQFYPEVAYITPEGIRIMPASEFAKH